MTLIHKIKFQFILKFIWKNAFQETKKQRLEMQKKNINETENWFFTDKIDKLFQLDKLKKAEETQI